MDSTYVRLHAELVVVSRLTTPGFFSYRTLRGSGRGRMRHLVWTRLYSSPCVASSDPSCWRS